MKRFNKEFIKNWIIPGVLQLEMKGTGAMDFNV